jgi:predicted transcriptional regulator
MTGKTDMTDTQTITLICGALAVMVMATYAALVVLLIRLRRQMDAYVLMLLADGPAEIEEIAAAMGLTSRQAAMKLLRLERTGAVRSDWTYSAADYGRPGTHRIRLYSARKG